MLGGASPLGFTRAGSRSDATVRMDDVSVPIDSKRPERPTDYILITQHHGEEEEEEEEEACWDAAVITDSREGPNVQCVH